MNTSVIVPDYLLSHPHYKPNPDEIPYIQERVANQPIVQNKKRQRQILFNVGAAILLWLIPDSNVRYYYLNKTYFNLFLFHAIQILSLVTYFTLSYSDPGYLTKKELNTVDIDMDNDTQSLLTQIPTVDLSSADAKVPSNFCMECKFFQPQRTGHCYLCNKCVSRWDHHCPLIDRCIGSNNYQLFCLYLINQFIISFWTFCVSINCLFYAEILYENNNIYYYYQLFLRILLFVCMLWQFAISIALIIYHSYLITTAQTTNEYMIAKLNQNQNMHKNNKITFKSKMIEYFCKSRKYEYSKGCIANWILFMNGKGLKKYEWSTPQYCFVKQ